MQKKFLQKNCEDVINSAAGKVRIERFPICLCVYAGNYASDALLRPKKKKFIVFHLPFPYKVKGSSGQNILPQHLSLHQSF